LRVCVTGATGFLGWHLCDGFRNAGWEVAGIVRPGSSKPLPQGVARIETRLSAIDLTPAIADSGLVVHAAGATRARSEDTFHSANVNGTQEVVRAVNAIGSGLIFISSQAAAGPATSVQPATEDDPPRPLTAYGRSKLAAEAAIRTSATGQWCILRPSSIYGPRDHQFLSLFRMAVRGRFPIVTPPSASYTFVHVDDVVRATIAAAADNRAVGQAFFVGHPEPASTAALLQAVALAVNRPYKPRRVPPMLLRLLAAAGELSWKLGRQPLLDRARLAELSAEGFVCSVEKLRACLGFEAAVPLGEGIRRTGEWYKREGWI
jgi:dihydroflavonol-4-reductase